MNLPPTCRHGHTEGWYVLGSRYECRTCRRNRMKKYRDNMKRLPDARLVSGGVHCPRPGAYIFKKKLDVDEFFATIESYRRKT